MNTRRSQLHRGSGSGRTERLVATSFLFCASLFFATDARAQAAPSDEALAEALSGPAAQVLPTALPQAPVLPLFLTVGLGYGQRFDPCAQCSSPQNIDSFTGHLSIGKYLVSGLGIGVDASVWRRGHPGAPAPPDSTGAPVPTSLVNQLGNVSLTASYQAWHVFVRGGLGVALGRQDQQGTDDVVVTAKGTGIGYTLGGGATLPVASMVSLVFFVNWNVGTYDLNSPTEVVERGVRHEVIEVGFGLTLR